MTIIVIDLGTIFSLFLDSIQMPSLFVAYRKSVVSSIGAIACPLSNMCWEIVELLLLFLKCC